MTSGLPVDSGDLVEVNCHEIYNVIFLWTVFARARAP